MHASNLRPLLALGLLIMLASGGCGRKAAPQPPEDVLPVTIVDLTGTDTPDGVVLTWARPKTYVDGRRITDLDGFVIERAPGDDVDAPFTELGRVRITDRERFQQQRRFRLVDPHTIVGATYRYRVVSFTTDEYFSAPSNIVIVERKSTY